MTEPTSFLKNKPGCQWGSIAAIAFAVVIANVWILNYGMTHQSTSGLFGWSIASVGLITFFGVLVMSALHTSFKPGEKGNIRRAIASSLIAVYIVLLSLTLSGDFSGTQDDILKDILTEFSAIIVIVIGFYFGQRLYEKYLENKPKPSKAEDKST